MQLRFRRSRCHAEHLGDFFVLIAFDVVKNEHSPRSCGQPANCFLEIEKVARCQRRSDNSGMRVHSSSVIVILFEPRTAATFALSSIEHDVHRQAMKPGAERALAAKELQLLPRPNEDVLRELFGAAAVARHPSAEGEDSIDVVAVEAFESTPVSSRRSRDV